MKKSLKDLRESAGITQTEISRATGISCSKLSLAENGFAQLTLSEQESVRKAVIELTHQRLAEVLEGAGKLATVRSQ